MYYPYLRGRQFELIAIRELASEEALQGAVIPIIEPVKEAINNLTLAHTIFSERAQTAYVIANPVVGDAQGDGRHFLEYLSSLELGTYLPAFHYHANRGYIEECIDEFNLHDCLLICPNDLSVEDADFKEVAGLDQVSIFTLDDPGRNRSLNRYLRSLGKGCIRLDDLFERQTRNADFLDIPTHRFSEEHLYFAEDHFLGFSDYTALASHYSDSGSTPRAVVIHLTYRNDQNQIWIRHFTSETNDSISNVQGKFAEAAAKAITYCRANSLTNSAIQELEHYYEDEHYPGLGTVKKISIKNHILVVAEYLRNR